MSAAATSTSKVSIQLRHAQNDDEECPGSLTNVHADIHVASHKVGTIDSLLVNRQRIPERYVHTLFERAAVDRLCLDGTTVWKDQARVSVRVG
jgi:hypothetical protein